MVRYSGAAATPCPAPPEVRLLKKTIIGTINVLGCASVTLVFGKGGRVALDPRAPFDPKAIAYRLKLVKLQEVLVA